MKLVRYGAPGEECPGILDAKGDVRDASGIVADWNGAAFATGILQREIDPAALPKVTEPVRFGSCVVGTRNLIAVGLNYADHAAESNMPVPVEPVLFKRPRPASLERTTMFCCRPALSKRTGNGACGCGRPACFLHLGTRCA